MKIRKKECDSFPKQLKHLKCNIEKNEGVCCPAPNCNKKYKIKSSFTGHLSKTHRMRESLTNDENNIEVIFKDTELVNDCDEQHQTVVKAPLGPDTFGSDSSNGYTVNYNDHLRDVNFDLFLTNMAQFFLKLETVCLVPCSTIQKIATENMSFTR